MKKIIFLVLFAVQSSFAQTFPVQNLVVNGTATIATPLGVASGGTNSGTPSGTALDNITGFSGTGYMSRTGAGTYTFTSSFAASSINYTAPGTGGVSIPITTIFGQTAYIDSYGAVGNGTTDDSTPLSNAATALGSAGGIVYLSCAKNYAILSNVTIPANVTVKQCRGNGPWGNPGIDWGTGPIAGQPHINVSSTNTIFLSSNSGFDGVIINSNITPPVQTPAAYAGTALSLAPSGANDVHVNALIVGFATCMNGSSGGDRQQWAIECDGNPAGGVGAVIVGPSFDTSHLRIRTYPWGTVAYPTSPQLTRTGIGTQILSSNQDDTQAEIMDFGHSTALTSSANGNIHFTRIWADNNSGPSVSFTNGGATTIDSMWVYTGQGAIFNGPADYNIGTFFCNTNSVAFAQCLTVGSGSNAVWMNVSNLDIEGSTSYGINMGNVQSHLSVGQAILRGIGTAAYINAASGGTSDQIQIDRVTFTDLAAGGSLIGGNTQTLPAIASGTTISPIPNYDHMLVTGTTNITNVQGTWNDRRIILTFNNVLTVNSTGGNLNLTGGNFTTSNGSSIALWYNQTIGAWFEMWRH